jgi:predicted phosphoribosyltransferase
MNPDAGIMSWEQADQIMQDQRAEIARLKEAVRRLADQDATLSVCDGNVTVTMDGTLTGAEREAVEEAMRQVVESDCIATPHALEVIGTLRGLLERMK